MSGYRGDGYGEHGNVGDDDFRWGDGRGERPDQRSEERWRDRDDSPERGAAHGNLMGRAEEKARNFLGRDDDHERGRDRPLAQDPRAVRAADEWRQRHGREGYEGSYGVHDDSYRQYREQHLAELDNDFQEYCREHGHEFSSAFENWRSGRPQRGQQATTPGQSGAGIGAAGGFSTLELSESSSIGSPPSATYGSGDSSSNLMEDESGGAISLGDETGAEPAAGTTAGKRKR
jgi:hypothetical protein